MEVLNEAFPSCRKFHCFKGVVYPFFDFLRQSPAVQFSTFHYVYLFPNHLDASANLFCINCADQHADALCQSTDFRSFFMQETNEMFDKVADLALELQQGTDIHPLWATAQLFKHPRYAQGAATR
jgi:hypothetical protein